jgi:two-component system, NtrC family, C4-dicarboxylate transport sensor histidine kinase DctB
MKNNTYRIITIVTFAIISIIAILITVNYTLKKEKELVSKRYLTITNNIQDKIKSIIKEKKNATLAISITLAHNKNILDILNHKIEDIQLDKLSLQLREETAFKNVWFQVVDTKGKSLYRSWTKERNDKLHEVRPDINEMIRNPKIKSTISVGKYDITFKSMVPIFENNKLVGIVESITHFNSISRGLRLTNNVEPIIIVEEKFTKQLRKNSFTKIFIKDFYIANLSVSKDIVAYLENKDINEFLNIKEYIVKDGYLIINSPIVYKDQKLASFISFKNIDDIDHEYIEEYKQNVFSYLALFILLLGLILFIISYYLYSNELKKLYIKLNKNQEELYLINKSLKKTVDDEVEKNYKKNKLLFQQSKMAAMGEMIGNIAHQWRQPLSMITTAASGIKLKSELGLLEDKEHKESLDSIIQTANYLSNTIDDFRYFFSPDRKKTHISSDELFKKIFKLLDAEYKSKNIQIIKNIYEIEIYTFENELIQVMINILNNAKDEFIKIKDYNNKYIFIDLYIEDKNIIIKIKDNAGGIPENIIDRIFEPYFTTKHQSQGTGIGLYMSAEIINKHLHGEILVSNCASVIKEKQYIGAEFTISIPL